MLFFRTLVVPSFTSHYTHSNKQLKPQNFIDVDRLCSFVSCISEEEMKKFCDNAFDVAFQVGKVSILICCLEQCFSSFFSTTKHFLYLKILRNIKKNSTKLKLR